MADSKLATWSSHTKLTADTPIGDRVASVASLINAMITDFEQGDVDIGGQCFQGMLMDKIRAAKLLDDGVITQVDKVGAHPDNREGAGMVPIDAHDLCASMGSA